MLIVKLWCFGERGAVQVAGLEFEVRSYEVTKLLVASCNLQAMNCETVRNEESTNTSATQHAATPTPHSTCGVWRVTCDACLCICFFRASVKHFRTYKTTKTQKLTTYNSRALT